MINTTTIATQVAYSSFLHICTILSLGLVVGSAMVELFLHKIREKEEYDTEDDDTTSVENYCERYLTEFETLAQRQLNEYELNNLNTKMVREEVADNVEVILTYDKSTETFWYYTDKLKEVSYDILETVARKFVIDYDCKMIYLQPMTPGGVVTEPVYAVPGEPTLTSETVSEPLTSETALTSETVSETAATEPVRDVFAKFKDYNTGGKGASPNFTSAVKVIEQMNHFRYRGKLCDYTEMQKLKEKKAEDTSETILDYASYKKLIEKKTL